MFDLFLLIIFSLAGLFILFLVYGLVHWFFFAFIFSIYTLTIGQFLIWLFGFNVETSTGIWRWHVISMLRAAENYPALWDTKRSTISAVEYAMQNGLVRDKAYLELANANARAKELYDRELLKDFEYKADKSFNIDNIRSQNAERFGKGYDGEHGLSGKPW